MIPCCVDPRFHRCFEHAKIDAHAARIESVGGDYEFDARVVPVQMATRTVVAENAMAVAEIDGLRHVVHAGANAHQI